MGQYISVYMDDKISNFKNKGLYDIIAFIGEKSYSGEHELSANDAYKRGKKLINSKLHKWHKTTINNLVTAVKKQYSFNYEQKTVKPLWKIHRHKAKKVFSVIYSLLKKYKDKGMLKLFDEICKKYDLSSGDEVAGSPYYAVIKDEKLLISQNYNNTDIKDLKKCAEKIQKFSEYH